MQLTSLGYGSDGQEVRCFGQVEQIGAFKEEMFAADRFEFGKGLPYFFKSFFRICSAEHWFTDPLLCIDRYGHSQFAFSAMAQSKPI